MECDKYDIFYIEGYQKEPIASFSFMYSITNIILFMAVCFWIIQIYWEITSQLQNNKSYDDCDTKESWFGNQDSDQYSSTEENTEIELLTQENTSFNTYVGLSSWLLDEELENIIDEKNSNIAEFQNKYSIQPKEHTNASFGPHLGDIKCKWKKDDVNLNSSFDQLKLNISSVISTDSSENWTSPSTSNILRSNQKNKSEKRVRFQF